MISKNVKEIADYFKSHPAEFDKHLREPMEKLVNEIKEISETVNYSALKRKRLNMQYHDFYSTSATGRERTLRAYYHEQAATSDSFEVQGTDTEIKIYKVIFNGQWSQLDSQNSQKVFNGRNIVRLLRQETIIEMEEKIKEENSVHI